MYRSSTTIRKLASRLVFNVIQTPNKHLQTTCNITKNFASFNNHSSKIYLSSSVRRHFRSQTSTQTDVDFARAQQNLSQITVDVSNEDKLLMYALFKQIQNGPCNTKKPSALDMRAKAKWLAWKQLGDMPESEAKEQYVTIVNRLVKESQETPNEQ